MGGNLIEIAVGLVMALALTALVIVTGGCGYRLLGAGAHPTGAAVSIGELDDRSREPIFGALLRTALASQAVERGELQDTDEEMLTLTLEMLIGPITMRALLTNQHSDGEFIYHLAESVYLYITRRDPGRS